jgi:hypothetical protein
MACTAISLGFYLIISTTGHSDPGERRRGSATIYSDEGGTGKRIRTKEFVASAEYRKEIVRKFGNE